MWTTGLLFTRFISIELLLIHSIIGCLRRDLFHYLFIIIMASTPIEDVTLYTPIINVLVA